MPMQPNEEQAVVERLRKIEFSRWYIPCAVEGTYFFDKCLSGHNYTIAANLSDQSVVTISWSYRATDDDGYKVADGDVTVSVDGNCVCRVCHGRYLKCELDKYGDYKGHPLIRFYWETNDALIAKHNQPFYEEGRKHAEERMQREKEEQVQREQLRRRLLDKLK